MTEPVAKALATVYRTTADLEKQLIAVARRPLRERVFANYYANPGGAKDGGAHNIRQYTGHLRRTEGAESTRTPAWYDTPDDYIETIPTMKAGMTQFLITGDSSRNKLHTMPGGGYSTIKVELPSNWDALMEELGYPPISKFYLHQ